MVGRDHARLLRGEAVVDAIPNLTPKPRPPPPPFFPSHTQPAHVAATLTLAAAARMVCMPPLHLNPF